MAIYEVYSRPNLIRYKASICSSTAWFYLLTVLIKFISPLIITYNSQGFWRKIDFYQEQPDVSFKHKMLIILETKSPDKLIFWSTYENINEVMKQEVFQSLPEIEHREEDFNKDGKKDELQMSIEFPLSNQEIRSVKVILVFDYKLSLYSDFRMESSAYIYHSSSLPGSEFNVIGDLTLFQREPLKHTGRDEKFNFPVIKDTLSEIPYNLEDIFLDYFKRNISTAFTNTYPVWKSAKAEKEFFKMSINVKYPIETIIYRVGFWQLLKWTLVQYVTFFIIISFIVHVIKSYVFENHLLPTIVFDPMKQKV